MEEKTYHVLTSRRKPYKSFEKFSTLGQISLGFEFQSWISSTTVIQMDCGCYGRCMAEEGIRQSDILIRDHINDTDDPGSMQ